MEYETEEVKKLHITEEMPAGFRLKITVDQLDSDDLTSFELTIGTEEFGWMGKDDLNCLKKVINRALKAKKTGE